MAVSGSADVWEAEQLAGKSLGVQYRLQEDEIFFVIRPCYYEAKQKSSDQVREVVVLDKEQVDELKRGKRPLSRRQVLSMVMGLYDPLGLVSPALLHGKLLLRRLYGEGAPGGWDADLPATEKTGWAQWFKSLLVPAEATFPRTTKPRNAVGSPRLVGFGDASLLALCAVLYVVWTDNAGVHHPRVLTGKCRVTPLLGTTVPRGELQALVMVHRLLATVVEAFPYRFETISVFTDSMCSVGALLKSPSSLRPYFCNRVMEINRIREQLGDLCGTLPPVCHIPGEKQPC